ncbi:pilus (MSHA type) biogenesis protein MshL, partial [bacterium]|nr:pilus (MSHA type) biogenesis protein MshL [bacterium]
SETRVSSGNVSDADANNSSSSSSDSSSNDSGSNNGRLVSTRITTENDTDFWTDLQLTLETLIGEGEQRMVIVTPHAGMVVVKALPQEIDTVREYLQSAELIMRRQVILEAKILEVRLSDGFQAGINWSALGRLENNKTVIAAQGASALSPLGTTNVFSEPAAMPGATVNPVENALNGFFGLTLNLNDFNAIIDMLETQGSVQVLSSPRISTVNNQKALIKVGQDEFFVTEVENSVTRDVGGTVNTPSVEFTPFFSGIALDVTPQISGDEDIVLHVHPTVSEVVEQERVFEINGENFNIPLAKSSIRESDSIIFAKSGQVVVIGGLIQNASNDTNAQVPWMGRLPGLGALFRQKSQTQVKSELVILLKPKVINADAMANDIADSSLRMQRMRALLK